MNSHISNLEFLQSFKTGELQPSDFNHEAHLRLAYLYIQEKGIEKAIREICQDLKNYTKFAGAEDKYHHTLTIAAIKTVNHFMGKSKAENFSEFIIEFPRLKMHFKELIAQHYSFDIFTNEKAKKEFVEPDLLNY